MFPYFIRTESKSELALAAAFVAPSYDHPLNQIGKPNIAYRAESYRELLSIEFLSLYSYDLRNDHQRFPLSVDPSYFDWSLEHGSNQTQVDLTQISCSKYKNAEKGLNRTFNQILKAHDSEPKFTKAFQEAHRTRLIFRNAHIRSFYPGSSLSPVSDNPSADYGSVYPMCACDLQTEITSQRIKQLRAIWVVGIEAGNVCGESAAVNPARSGSRDK